MGAAANRISCKGTTSSPGRGEVLAKETSMNAIIYLVGLVVVVMFILSFLGLR